MSDESRSEPPALARNSGPVDPGPSEPGSHTGGAAPDEELEALRALLVAEEKHEIETLRERIEEREFDAEDLAKILPDAVLLDSTQEQRLGKALAPTIDDAIQESVKRDPSAIADAIFPVIGPAIRKAIGQALAQTIESLNTTVEHSISPRGIRWRIEAWRTGRPFAEVVLSHSLIWRAEQVFLIHGETGVVLEDVSAAEGLAQDTDLVSSMLTAIQDFCADSFMTDEQRPVHEIAFDDFLVLVASGPKAGLAAVVRGRPPAEFRTRLDQAIEAVHARHSAHLSEFDGDTSHFVTARPLLEDCLGEEQRVTERSAASYLPVFVAGVAVVALALFASRVLLQRVGETRAAEEAFRALDDAPGIYVGSHRRVDGDEGADWLVAGLRDPDSPDPAKLLERAGMDPARVLLQLEAIQSFEPEIIASRAERLLESPPGVRLSVEDGKLVARGYVPLDWLAAARSRLGLVDGVEELIDASRSE